MQTSGTEVTLEHPGHRETGDRDSDLSCHSGRKVHVGRNLGTVGERPVKKFLPIGKLLMKGSWGAR